MPGHKNPMPTNEGTVHCTKLAKLEQACKQLLEEECEVAARHECEVMVRCECEVVERQRWETVERQECEVMETQEHSHQQNRCPHSEAEGLQAW